MAPNTNTQHDSIRPILQKIYGRGMYQIRTAENDRYGYDRDYIVSLEHTPEGGGRNYWAFRGYLDEFPQQFPEAKTAMARMGLL